MRRVLIVLAALAAALAMVPASADVEPNMAIGIDIPGNDFTHFELPAPDPALCRQACDQADACRAWTFVKPGVQAAGAMCWLKSSSTLDNRISTAVISGVKLVGYIPDPGVGSARISASMDMGVDEFGGDVQSFALPRADPALCEAACNARGDCRAWTFAKTQPGTGAPPACWLKSGATTPTANLGVISGLVNRSAGGGPPGGGGPGAGGGPGSTAWGVWAYRDLPPFDWNDPCAIQYVAAPIDTPRYAGNPSQYRLVRTRTTQSDADLDIDQFGRFHRNQPDGVVKMTSCVTDTENANGGSSGNGGGSSGGPWTGTYVTDSFPTTFQFSGGGSSLSASFDGHNGDAHNTGSMSCRPAGDEAFDCDYRYHHEDSEKTGEVTGTMHLTRTDRCTLSERSRVTAVDLHSLDGSPATSPSMYVGAEGSNTYHKQGCS